MSKVTTDFDRGARFYVDEARPEVTRPGVTSILGMLPKQDFLGPWQAGMAADLALDSIDYLKSMAARDKKGARAYLVGASRRYTQARGKLGSRVHDVIERLLNGEDVRAVHPDITQHVEHFRQFLAAVNPELVLAEEIAWSDKHDYAGSFDAILRVWLDDDFNATPDRSGTPRLLMVDWKTSKNTYTDVALQLAAYRHAETLIDNEGNRSPMPATDGAAVLHITDETWTFKIVDASEEVFEHFLTLRKTFDWVRDRSKHVLGKPMAKKARGRMVTGTQRRASR